jgi:hypothetical protein
MKYTPHLDDEDNEQPTDWPGAAACVAVVILLVLAVLVLGGAI